MFFKRSVQRYGRTPEPETPYQRAGQLWDERIGSARVQAKSWRLIAFGGLALTAAMAGALVWQARQSRVVPYVVEVDRLGEARAVQPADRDYQPDDAQVAWHLARFIEHVRTVSLDPVLMRRDWLSAYDFVTARGSRFLSAYARSARPFDAIGEKTVSVEVTSVVRASDRSFQVKWTETAFDHGEESGRSHWTAILSVVRHPPATADVLCKNPLGIYVDAIDWSREFEPAAVPPPEPAQATYPTVPAGAAAAAPHDRGAASARSAILTPESQP
jgi:type IV secretion system protein VirB5